MKSGGEWTKVDSSRRRRRRGFQVGGFGVGVRYEFAGSHCAVCFLQCGEGLAGEERVPVSVLFGTPT